MKCPFCDHDNFAGADICSSCELDLAGLDIKAWGIRPEDPHLARRVRDLPIKQAIEVTPETTAAEAIGHMIEWREGCVFVTERRELRGVFTERDVATRVAARDLDPTRLRVDSVMTPNPFTVRNDDRVALAIHRMGVDGFRHLPVLDSAGHLEGFLSMRGVLKVLAAS